jgi:dTDP-4-dehydrorhamnose reductase
MKVLVTGAEGMLARALRETLAARGHEVTALSRRELDVTDAPHVQYIVDAERPEVVVQCAAYTRVDDAERDESGAARVNADGALHVARACHAVGARFVYPSTDYVFDGTAHAPYAPAARPAPLNAYGRTKLAGEHAARAAGDALIVRTSWLYAPHGRNFVRTMLERGRAGQPLRVVDDQRGAPTVVSDLANMIVLLLERAAPAGCYHATNAGETTWFGLARAAFDIAGITADLSPIESAQFPQPAKRPAYSVLDCSATYALTGEAPHWRDALHGVIAAGVTA